MKIDRSVVAKAKGYAGNYEVKSLAEEQDSFGYIVYFNIASDGKFESLAFVDEDELSTLVAAGHWFTALNSGRKLVVSIVEEVTVWGPHTPKIGGFIIS